MADVLDPKDRRDAPAAFGEEHPFGAFVVDVVTTPFIDVGMDAAGSALHTVLDAAEEKTVSSVNAAVAEAAVQVISSSGNATGAALEAGADALAEEIADAATESAVSVLGEFI